MDEVYENLPTIIEMYIKLIKYHLPSDEAPIIKG